MFIDYLENIVFLEREYIETYDVYHLSDEELKEFKRAYKLVKQYQLEMKNIKKTYSDDGKLKNINMEYEIKLNEFNKFKFDGVVGEPVLVARKKDEEEYDPYLYTDEEFKKNIENELLSKIVPGRIRINNDFVSRLFFIYEGLVISKIDQLFNLKISLLQNECDWSFEVTDAILGIFNQVTINSQNIFFDGFIDEDSELDAIFGRKTEYFDRMKMVDIWLSEMKNDKILTVDCRYDGVNIYHKKFKRISINFPYKEILPIEGDTSFKHCFEYIFNSLIRKYSERTLLKLNGFFWKEKYEIDEQLFCDEIVSKLLRKMNFSSVRFYHGIKEYGKDFIFSETDKFGHQIYYGLQAKAGDVSGKARSKIDEIIGQLDDAFSMPFEEIGSGNKHYISNFIIAISGNFTENAKDKIKTKIPRDKSGSVFFLDKEKIIQLAEKYWLL